MITCKVCGRKPDQDGAILRRTNRKAKVARFICSPGTGCREKYIPGGHPRLDQAFSATVRARNR